MRAFSKRITVAAYHAKKTVLKLKSEYDGWRYPSLLQQRHPSHNVTRIPGLPGEKRCCSSLLPWHSEIGHFLYCIQMVDKFRRVHLGIHANRLFEAVNYVLKGLGMENR